MKDKSTFIGKHFGGYQVTAKIACGYSGCVYLAQHTMLSKRFAAIKVMHSSHLHAPQERERFLHEAEFLVILKHTHILLIYDYGIDENENLPYLIMEYAQGGSLRDLLDKQKQQPLPLAQSLTIIEQVGDALQYAHDRGIVHRDLKPENILFNEQGEVLLTDFNIAIVQNTTNIAKAIDVMGTPPYMAPEQFDGRVSRRSDQYSLGCISYELFTGRKPFQAHNTGVLMHQHKYENPLPLKLLNPRIPESIEQAVLKTMSKRRINRYMNVSQFIKDLRNPPFSQASDTTVPNVSLMDKEQWLSEGIQLRKFQRYKAALEADEQALMLDYNFSLAYNNKGNCLFYLKRYDAALEAYEQALLRDPHLPMPYNNKAIILLNQKHAYKEALTAFERAIHLDPTYAEAYYGKSRALFKLSQFGDALAACEQATSLDHTFALAYHGLSIILIQFGRYPEALDAIGTALQIDSQRPAFHYSKGNILLRLGRNVEAEQAYKMGNQLEKQ